MIFEKYMHYPLRLLILSASLNDSEGSIDIYEARLKLGISKEKRSRLSNYLKILEEDGYIKKQGKYNYHLTDKAVSGLKELNNLMKV